MADVLQFRKRDSEDGGPYLEGEARCLACGHECISVRPVGVFFAECPKCNTFKCVPKHPVSREGEHWKCKCGCEAFFVHREIGMYCVNCGTTHRPFD